MLEGATTDTQGAEHLYWSLPRDLEYVEAVFQSKQQIVFCLG